MVYYEAIDRNAQIIQFSLNIPDCQIISSYEFCAKSCQEYSENISSEKQLS